MDDPRTALGELVRRRRIALGLSINDAAKLARMSPTTWGRMEQGRKVRNLAHGGADRVLGWQEGTSLEFLSTRRKPSVRTNWSPIDLRLAQAIAQIEDLGGHMDRLNTQLEEASDEQRRDSLQTELIATQTKMGELNAEVGRLNQHPSTDPELPLAGQSPEDASLREFNSRVKAASQNERHRRAIVSLLRVIQDDDA